MTALEHMAEIAATGLVGILAIIWSVRLLGLDATMVGLVAVYAAITALFWWQTRPSAG